MGIPTIDISLFYEYENPSKGGLYDDPSVERTKAVNTLLASLSTHGAFKITGHGISGSMIQRVFDSASNTSRLSPVFPSILTRRTGRRLLQPAQAYQKVGGRLTAQKWSSPWVLGTRNG